MKNHLKTYLYSLAILVFVVACSTKKNTFLSRNSHALSTKYNILYNGGIALDKGVADLASKYKDNFWELLPIERMQVAKEQILPGQAQKDANFERAEEKATKAIQKHSMNIGGSEKNTQIDEAYLMLGKARYYDQRFVPALEAFNYILYKYPTSSKIFEAKIWREKTNMRLENDEVAIKNLNQLLEDIKKKDQIYADANATIAQAFLNLKETDSAIAKLKLARDYTEKNEEKSRYFFILGQLYESLEYKDSAYASYQSVIDMNRNAARQYVIQAHAKQALQFDAATGDTVKFLKKFDKLLADRENRPFLDVLNHQLALYYDRNKNYNRAKSYYNASLKKKSENQYLTASNYRNLATIYFDDAKYAAAGKYYDSTLVNLEVRTREYRAIKKKRENLEDVIKYEAIATRNDSILKVLAMSDSQKTAYYEDYITKLKAAEELKAKLEKENAKFNNNDFGNTDIQGNESAEDVAMAEKMSQKAKVLASETAPNTVPNPASNNSQNNSTFYFYNDKTLAFGKIEFKKNWGNRKLQDNWRYASDYKNAIDNSDENQKENDTLDSKEKSEKDLEVYKPEFYISQLPQTQKETDSIGKERNFAYYQLGLIYKEKFKEYKLAANKLEALLKQNPEERLILPSMYHLYKIYQIIDPTKALAMKEQIIAQYPTSRYAQILSNENSESALAQSSPDAAYDKLYDSYLNGDFKNTLADTEEAIDIYTGEDIVPKLELLKTTLSGRLKGLDEYKKGLNYVALNYPNNEEGKTAELYLANEVPKMEALQFYDLAPKSYKLLYKAKDSTEVNTKNLVEKIRKFIKERSIDRLTVSLDVYTMDDNFIVIHNIISDEYAKGIASILKEFKEYKIQDTAYPISNENYKIVQIKKNFEEYLKTPPHEPKPVAATPIPALRGAPEKQIQQIQQNSNNDTKKNMPPSLNGDDPKQEFQNNNQQQMPQMSIQPQTELKKK